MATLTIKATLDGVNRRFAVPDTITYPALCLQLAGLFSTSAPFALTYEDTDGDVITVSSNVELAELVTSAKALATPVARIHLATRSTTPALAAPTPMSDEGAAPENRDIGALVSGVSQLLTVMQTNADGSAPLTITADGHGDDIVPGNSARDMGEEDIVMPDAQPRRKGIFAGLRPYVRAIPESRAVLKKVSDETKSEFKILVRFVKKSNDRDALVAALRDSFPLLRCWLIDELGGEGNPDAAKVDMLASAAHSRLAAKSSVDFANRVTHFARLALDDPAVVEFLRMLSKLPVPWERGLKPASGRVGKAGRGAGLRMQRKAAKARCADTPRKGLFAGLRPYWAALPAGKAELKQNFRNVSPKCKIEFKKLVRSVKQDKQGAMIVTALREAFPILREWMAGELGDEEVPSTQSIDRLVSGASEKLVPSIGEDMTSRVTSFARNALTEEPVVRSLRLVRGMGTMPWEEGFVSSHENVAPKGLNVHSGTVCANCMTRPIVGLRYHSVNRKDYDVCGACYASDAVVKQGMDFKEINFPWEVYYPGATAPPATLKTGDRGAKVKFLHKVLTDLGFMNESMYLDRPGLYSFKTRAAVEQFQLEKNVSNDSAKGVYDQATADSLAAVVDDGGN